MKNKLSLGLFLLVGLLHLQAQDNRENANNKFAFDLLKIVDSKENMCVSPFSISSAIAMTYAGSANETKEQIEKVFHFEDVESTNQQYRNLHKQLNDFSISKTKLSVANSIWVQSDLELQVEYLRILKENYLSNAFEVDYKLETEQSREKINSWVSDKTEEKITDLLQPGVISPLTRLVLVNAIYFKSPWKKQFKIAKTYKDDFYLSKKKKSSVDFMQENITLKYLDSKLFSAIDIPYENENLSMLIIVPKGDKSRRKLSKQINISWYNELLKGMTSKHVDVNVPKFKFRNNLSLKQYLSKMGMPVAFKNDADFSGITGDLSLKIDDVIHEAYIDVNEEGTEAAAATAVVMRVKSFIRNEKPIVFKADKPFYFIIKENGSNTILFIGMVTNPQN